MSQNLSSILQDFDSQGPSGPASAFWLLAPCFGSWLAVFTIDNKDPVPFNN